MIPTIGLIVAAYAIARLIQVPIEACGLSYRWGILLLVSFPAIGVILYLVIDLLMNAAKAPTLPGLP